MPLILSKKAVREKRKAIIAQPDLPLDKETADVEEVAEKKERKKRGPNKVQAGQAQVHFEKTIRLSHSYQSIEFKCGVTLPCEKGEHNLAFSDGQQIVEAQLEKAIQAVLDEGVKLVELSQQAIK